MSSHVMEVVQGLVDFGIATASAVTENVKQVTVTILGIEDPDGNEQRSEQVLYGNAAVLLRPAAPDSNGVGMEVVFVRSGDDMVPVAHRETRWQVDLEEGEVVVRALGASAGRIRMKASGEVVVESNDIKLVSSSASEGIPLGDALKTYLDNHAHGYVDSVGSASVKTPGLTTAPSVAVPTPLGVLLPGTADLSPDPSTKAKVE